MANRLALVLDHLAYYEPALPLAREACAALCVNYVACGRMGGEVRPLGTAEGLDA